MPLQNTRIAGSCRVAAPLEQDPGPCPGWGPETTDTAAILVVDDNDDNRYTLIHRLDMASLNRTQLTPATSGESAAPRSSSGR